MGSQPRFPGWLLGSCWDSPRELTLDRGPGGSVGAAPPPRSGFWVPKGIGVQSPPPPNTASMQKGYQMVPGHSPWSPSGRGGNSESSGVLIQASHLFFGHEWNLSHFDPTVSCPSAFHCLWSRLLSVPRCSYLLQLHLLTPTPFSRHPNQFSL